MSCGQFADRGKGSFQEVGEEKRKEALRERERKRLKINKKRKSKTTAGSYKS
jgi:hypothetical protein